MCFKHQLVLLPQTGTETRCSLSPVPCCVRRTPSQERGYSTIAAPAAILFTSSPRSLSICFLSRVNSFSKLSDKTSEFVKSFKRDRLTGGSTSLCGGILKTEALILHTSLESHQVSLQRNHYILQSAS